MVVDKNPERLRISDQKKKTRHLDGKGARNKILKGTDVEPEKSGETIDIDDIEVV